MEFYPESNEIPEFDIPYHDELRAADGWQGQTTTLSIERLKADITNALSKLGGMVHQFHRGYYEIGGKKRPGVQIIYSVEGPQGKMAYGRFDIASAPVKEPSYRRGWQETMRRREDQSLRTGLYNVVQALKAQWVLKKLNPSYMPLIPWMLIDGERTVNEAYREAGVGGRLLPSSVGELEKDVVDGEWETV
jgi:hypothetical protein